MVGNMSGKKTVEEVEKEFREFRMLVRQRERVTKKGEELRSEWFSEANKKYFTPKRIVRKAIDDVEIAILTGKKIELNKIIRKIEEKVSPDAAKELRDTTNDAEFAQKLRDIERAISNAYKEDKEIGEKLRLSQRARKLSNYYRAKVVAELEKRGEWEPMTLEELKEELEKHKDVIEGGA